ncbi:uncharacterized [Tachysurus ichikawai]
MTGLCFLGHGNVVSESRCGPPLPSQNQVSLPQLVIRVYGTAHQTNQQMDKRDVVFSLGAGLLPCCRSILGQTIQAKRDTKP